MNVLVAYASKRGSTAEIAQALASALVQRPFWVFSSGPVGAPEENDASSE